jgi:hypothetical protein
MKKSELKTKAAKALLEAGWDIENVFEVLIETKRDILLENCNPVMELPESNIQAFKKYFQEGFLQLVESGKFPESKPINHI